MRKTLAFISVLVGLFASSYLLWSYEFSTRRMVCNGSGCDTVRTSKHAHLWGLSLPVYGVAFYVLLAVLMLVEAWLPQHSKRIWRLLLICTAGGMLFAAWLTVLEAFVIHAWCEWCVTQAISVTIAFLLSLTIVLKPGESAAQEKTSAHQWRSRLAVLAIAIVVGVPAFALIVRSEKAVEQTPAVVVPQGSATLIRADSYEVGPANAPLTIVEFGDFQCPSCGVAEQTNRTIRDQYGDKVRFVFRQYPLEKVHQFAFQAAKASECAGQQGKFWPMVEELYTNQTDLSAQALKKYAVEEGLDAAKFDACLEDPALTTRIRQDIADGEALGVRATQTFFVNGKKIEGGLTLLDIEKALTDAKRQKAEVPPPSTAQPNQAGGDKAKLENTAASAATTKSQPAKNDSSKQAASSAPAQTASAGFGFSQAKNPLATPTNSSAFVPCGLEESPAQDPPMIHVVDMKKLVDAKSATFVDVRGSGAFKDAHIPGAVNITLAQLEKGIPAELSKSKQIVFYEAGGADDSCTTSKTAGRILMQNGFKEVKVFKEGFEGWKKQGLQVVQ